MNASKLWGYFGTRKNRLAYGLIVQVIVLVFLFLLLKGLTGFYGEFDRFREILSSAIPFISLGIILRLAFTREDLFAVIPMTLVAPLIFAGLSLYTALVTVICVSCGYGIARYAKSRSWAVWISLVGAILQILVNSLVWYMVFGDKNLATIFFSSFLLLVTAPGFLAVLLFIGEEVFSISTELRILDLCNEASPLLRSLRNVAPGTYYHSINTAFIAEEGASAIGADRILCRAGGLYHDIGKMWKPEYYSENQFEKENVHEEITRDVSRLIIISHIEEGIKLAAKYGLGNDIEEIIRRHHGDAPLYYYDYRIRRETDRYPGPAPITREEGIVLLSDSVEATARSLTEMSEGNLSKVVRFVIARACKDEQLSGVNFTERDLHVLEGAFLRSLKIIYHNRIFYPSHEVQTIGGGDDPGLFEKLSEEPESKDPYIEKDGERGPGGFEYH